MSWYRRKKRTRKAKKAASPEEKCTTKWCTNKCAVNTHRYVKADGSVTVYKKKLPYCWKCKSRLLLERHPLTYVLNALRRSAKKRNLDFSLTLESFTKFCQETKYLERRGQQPDSLTIDRIDRTQGYHIWNIQVMSHAENSAQGADNTPREQPDVVDGGGEDPF